MRQFKHNDIDKYNDWIARHNESAAASRAGSAVMIFMSIILGGTFAIFLPEPFNQWLGGLCLVVAIVNYLQLKFGEYNHHNDIDDMTH